MFDRDGLTEGSEGGEGGVEGGVSVCVVGQHRGCTGRGGSRHERNKEGCSVVGEGIGVV